MGSPVFWAGRFSALAGGILLLDRLRNTIIKRLPAAMQVEAFYQATLSLGDIHAYLYY